MKLGNFLCDRRIMAYPCAIFALLLIVFPNIAIAQHDDSHAMPYAGEQSRPIKSLSEQDIAELRAGRGWSLALPAELNGQPGPTHVLELQKELDLTPAQITAVTAIFENMRSSAIQAGEDFITAELMLSNAFANTELDQDTLIQLLAESEAARSTLRFIHLSAHLTTRPILTRDQINTYNRLRGYSDDPCATAPPEGHDPAMWRSHNGCE